MSSAATGTLPLSDFSDERLFYEVARIRAKRKARLAGTAPPPTTSPPSAPTASHAPASPPLSPHSPLFSMTLPDPEHSFASFSPPAAAAAPAAPAAAAPPTAAAHRTAASTTRASPSRSYARPSSSPVVPSAVRRPSEALSALDANEVDAILAGIRANRQRRKHEHDTLYARLEKQKEALKRDLAAARKSPLEPPTPHHRPRSPPPSDLPAVPEPEPDAGRDDAADGRFAAFRANDADRSFAFDAANASVMSSVSTLGELASSRVSQEEYVRELEARRAERQQILARTLESSTAVPLAPHQQLLAHGRPATSAPLASADALNLASTAAAAAANAPLPPLPREWAREPTPEQPEAPPRTLPQLSALARLTSDRIARFRTPGVARLDPSRVQAVAEQRIAQRAAVGKSVVAATMPAGTPWMTVEDADFISYQSGPLYAAARSELPAHGRVLGASTAGGQIGRSQASLNSSVAAHGGGPSRPEVAGSRARGGGREHSRSAAAAHAPARYEAIARIDGDEVASGALASLSASDRALTALLLSGAYMEKGNATGALPLKRFFRVTPDLTKLEWGHRPDAPPLSAICLWDITAISVGSPSMALFPGLHPSQVADRVIVVATKQRKVEILAASREQRQQWSMGLGLLQSLQSLGHKKQYLDDHP